MRRIIILLPLLLIAHLTANSQGRGNNWVFGDSTGVSFTNGQPVPFISVINSAEPSATISDEQGNLLFYNGNTNGNMGGPNFYITKVWDRNYSVMPNGDSLQSTGTTTQGCIILTYPGDSTKFYIFNLGLDINSNTHHLYYSRVNMILNGGYGDVFQKNILICDSPLTEKMCAVKHGNGRDWWLITHLVGTNDFYNYLITLNKIIGPFIQPMGDTILNNGEGQMTFNQQGTKLAYANMNGQLDVFDFDRCTGIISSPSLLGDPPYICCNPFYYGCSFSANSTVFYASTLDSLFQFDINSTNIKASKTLIGAHGTISSGGTIVYEQHLIGPNGKIYIALIDYMGANCDSLTKHLSVINDPDQLGSACNFAPFSIPLANCSRILGGLPNMPNYNLRSEIGSACDTITSVETAATEDVSIKVYPNPAHGNITLEFSGPVGCNNINIIQLDGKIVSEIKYSSPEKSVSINLSNLQAGFYEMHLTNDKGLVIHKKIIIK